MRVTVDVSEVQPCSGVAWQVSIIGQHEASKTAAELHWASHVPMMTATRAAAKTLRMTSAAMRGDSKNIDACQCACSSSDALVRRHSKSRLMSWCATLFGRNAAGAAINARGIGACWVSTCVDQHSRFAAHNRPHCVLPCVRTFVQARGRARSPGSDGSATKTTTPLSMLTEITDEASGLNNYHIGSYDADILYGWEVTFRPRRKRRNMILP